jgi:hypothetical protein
MPTRRKQDRLVGATDLFDFGLDLIKRASSASTALQRAVTYRDGLMISILSFRPLRLTNLVGLELGRTFVWRGETWWIDTPGKRRKRKKQSRCRFPTS